MPAPDAQPAPLAFRFLAALAFAAVLVGLMEYWVAVAPVPAPGQAPPFAHLLSAYRDMRTLWGPRLIFVVPGAGVAAAVFLLGCKSLARRINEMREENAGMKLETEDYGLRNPFAGPGLDPLAGINRAFHEELTRYDDRLDERPGHLLGFDSQKAPVYIGDGARDKHLHILGLIGSGKTRSALLSLLLQDFRYHWRPKPGAPWQKRSLVLLDMKGDQDIRRYFASLAYATGRDSQCYQLQLSDAACGHSYNPFFLAPGADPGRLAARVFAQLQDEMDNSFYRNQQEALWRALVRVAAATGKQAILDDYLAALQDPTCMAALLAEAWARDDLDAEAVMAARTIESEYEAVKWSAGKIKEKLDGLRSGLARWRHPIIQTYDPDIILEDIAEQGYAVSFSLSANAYKNVARALSVVVLQHVQQIGAMRQADRSLSQAPLNLYIDEFYDAVYPDFLSLLNKLRDANVCTTLSHQNFADLELISPAFRDSVLSNTRNRLVFFQNNPDTCEYLSNTVGTLRDIKQTVRRTVDAYGSSAAALESSNREADCYAVHPNAWKRLTPGQAYFLQDGVADRAALHGSPQGTRLAASRAGGVNLPMISVPAGRPTLPAPKALDRDSGLCLHKLFSERT